MVDVRQSLPVELWVAVMNYLSVKEVSRCRLVCRRWRDIASSNGVWKWRARIRGRRSMAHRMATGNIFRLFSDQYPLEIVTHGQRTTAALPALRARCHAAGLSAEGTRRELIGRLSPAGTDVVSGQLVLEGALAAGLNRIMLNFPARGCMGWAVRIWDHANSWYAIGVVRTDRIDVPLWCPAHDPHWVFDMGQCRQLSTGAPLVVWNSPARAAASAAAAAAAAAATHESDPEYEHYTGGVAGDDVGADDDTAGGLDGDVVVTLQLQHKRRYCVMSMWMHGKQLGHGVRLPHIAGNYRFAVALQGSATSGFELVSQRHAPLVT